MPPAPRAELQRVRLCRARALSAKRTCRLHLLERRQGRALSRDNFGAPVEGDRAGGLFRFSPMQAIMDLSSEAMRREPFPAYEAARNSSPVFYHEAFGVWMIFDFADVKRTLMDHDDFSSDLSHVPGHGNPGEWFIFFDPPRHTQTARAHLQGVHAAGRRGLGTAHPGAVTGAAGPDDRAWRDGSGRGILRPPADAGDRGIARHSHGGMAAVQALERRDPELANTILGGEEAARSVGEYRAITAEMRAFLPDLIAERRAARQDDLLSRLVDAEVDGERLTPGGDPGICATAPPGRSGDDGEPAQQLRALFDRKSGPTRPAGGGA